MLQLDVERLIKSVLKVWNMPSNNSTQLCLNTRVLLPEAAVFLLAELWARSSPPPTCTNPSDGECGTASPPREGRPIGLVSLLNPCWLLQGNHVMHSAQPRAEEDTSRPGAEQVNPLLSVTSQRLWGAFRPAPNKSTITFRKTLQFNSSANERIPARLYSGCMLIQLPLALSLNQAGGWVRNCKGSEKISVQSISYMKSVRVTPDLCGTTQTVGGMGNKVNTIWCCEDIMDS